MNFATLHNEISALDRWDHGLSYRLGGFAELPINTLGIHLEINYSNLRVNGDLDDRIALGYLSIPASLTYQPIDKIKLYLGPELNFLLNQTGPEFRRTNGDENFEDLEYGVHGQLEFFPVSMLGISIRNYFGLQYNGEAAVTSSTLTGLYRLNVASFKINYYL